MSKKILIGLVVVSLAIVLAGCGLQNNSQQQTAKEPIKIGAVLALSGPSAIWGQSVQNGMNLALEDHPELAVTYEDSKGTAADGVTAYQKLKTLQPDVFVSALSIVNVPLSKLALTDKIPLVITQSAANGITNEYTFRYYTDADHFALPSFESDISPLKNASVKKIAVVYRKDEYAQSVANKIKELSDASGKTIVFMESYVPNETDFSTIMNKAKKAAPDALLFIPTPPSESLGILKKAEELKFKVPIIEVSNVQSDPETQAKAPKMTFYTNQFAFSIAGNSEQFKTRYQAKYGKVPNFVAAFGYDIVNLIASCDKSNIKECLEGKKEVTGVTGVAKDIKNNDIVIPMYLLKVN